jgi:3-oxoacyl-[acyl-carrier-protein] synthase II
MASYLATEENKHPVDLKIWGEKSIENITPLWMLKYLPNMLACHVTIIHGLMGPSNTITCADASSHLAIGEAFRTIQRGKADLAICGGAESRLNPMGQIRQALLGRLNDAHNDTPAAAVRPFDAEAKGTVFGEGGGLLILEELEHAKKRGAKIYAELVGFAASQDTYKVTEPDPSGHSYGKAIENSLKDAKLSPSDVDLLIPHGMGIAPFDRAELNGLRKSLGDDLPRIALAPVKSQIGCLGAGCGADAAAAVLSIDSNKIPPAVNTLKAIDGQKLNVAPATREQNVNVAVSSVYSLGGQNAALVFRRA